MCSTHLLRGFMFSRFVGHFSHHFKQIVFKNCNVLIPRLVWLYLQALKVLKVEINESVLATAVLFHDIFGVFHSYVLYLAYMGALISKLQIYLYFAFFIFTADKTQFYICIVNIYQTSLSKASCNENGRPSPCFFSTTSTGCEYTETNNPNNINN